MKIVVELEITEGEAHCRITAVNHAYWFVTFSFELELSKIRLPGLLAFLSIVLIVLRLQNSS